ncbi:MAG TPA: molybdate ABC transporter permease subunit [Moraxellaceae bacterium]|nr:molybdate ABC transporter permease subunit [Moraxellaceae bacterium]
MVLSPEEWSALALSARVAFWCTVLGLVPGVALAWLLARCEFVGKALLDSVVHLPMVLPPVVPGYMLLLTFGHQGWLGAFLERWLGVSVAFHWTGAVLASLVMGLPLQVQPIRLAFQLVDARLEGAARTLGAGPWRVFFTISLPLAMPGLLVGAILAFSRSLGEFGATITFVGNIEGETRTLPLAIYTYVSQPGGEAPAMRLILVSVALALAALMASNALTRRAQRALGYRDHA